AWAGGAAAGGVARLPRTEHLVPFAVDDALLVAAAGVGRDHPPPEIHRTRVAQILADLPAAGEAAEDESHRLPPDAETAPRARDEELRHAVIGARRRRAREGTQHAREPDRLLAAHDHERIGVGIGDPVRDKVGLAAAYAGQARKEPGAGIEGVEVLAVDTLDPQPVRGRTPRVTHTDQHRAHRLRSLRAPKPRLQKENGPDGSPCEPSGPYVTAVSARLTASAAAGSGPPAWSHRQQTEPPGSPHRPRCWPRCPPAGPPGWRSQPQTGQPEPPAQQQEERQLRALRIPASRRP